MEVNKTLNSFGSFPEYAPGGFFPVSTNILLYSSK